MTNEDTLASWEPSESLSAPSLRHIVEDARRRTVVVRPGGRCYRATLTDLTALSDQNDPFRIDTDANHRDGAWLGELWERVGHPIHCRGLHYAGLGTPKPNGDRYINTPECWEWIQKAAAAARWLGYVDFDAITDERNAEPIWRPFEPPQPRSHFTFGGVEIVVPDEITPDVMLDDFRGVQPYNLALFGEKASLEPILGLLAARYQAHLLLPTGEASASMCNALARLAAQDGRPLVVLYFSDCDPAGWQMAVSVSRKMQGLEAGFFPELEWSLIPVALTPEQVREHGLPETPLKKAEKRAGKWTKAMGVEQTEIDALATLQPDVLSEIAETAISRFFDPLLDTTAEVARVQWEQKARQAIVERVGEGRLEQLRAEAEAKIAELMDEVQALNAAMRIPELGDVELPELPEPPEPEVENFTNPCLPLISSNWSWVDQTRSLVRHKSYGTAPKHIENPACLNCGKLLIDRDPNLTVCSPECGRAWRKQMHS